MRRFFQHERQRSQLLRVLDSAFEGGQRLQEDKRGGQGALFGTPDASLTTARTASDVLPDVEEYKSADLLKFEKELLGFYITSHPLTEHQAALDRYTTATTKEAMAMSEGAEVLIGGMISSVKKKITKSGRSAGMPWAIIGIEDLEGQIEGMVFGDIFADIARRMPDALSNESILFVKGRVDRKRETPSIVVSDVILISDAVSRLTTAMAVKLDRTRHQREVVIQMKPLLQKYKGNVPFFVQLETPLSPKLSIRLDRGMGVRPGKELVDDLERLLGTHAVKLSGNGSRRLKRLEQQKLFEENKPEGDQVTEVAAIAEDMAEEMELEAGED